MKSTFFKNDLFFTSLFWVVVFSVFWLQVFPQTESVMESFLFSVVFMVLMYFPVTYLSRKLLPKAIRTKRFKRFAFQFIFSSIIVGFLFAVLLYLFEYLETVGIFPYSYYFDMSEIKSVFIFVVFSAGVFINLCMCGLQFLLEYINSQKTVLEYQLRTLQHQVTPHFMFNVLNHIHTLMQTDVELASSLLIKYSEILRYQLYNGDKEKVTLEQDIQFLKDFIAVEEVRWDDKLTVNCSWTIENGTQEIPALLFITFIENAFKYVSKSGLEKGYINIDFKQYGNVLELNVENSKSSIQSKSNNSNGLGLRNIQERLSILFHDRHTLSIEETDSVYHVKVVINT